jgi:hypothetical protein
MSGTASSAAALRRALAARLPPFSPRAAARGISSTAQPNVRTANPGLRATIFGAYGFTGRYITNLLASDGVQCVAQGLGLGLCARARTAGCSALLLRCWGWACTATSHPH